MLLPDSVYDSVYYAPEITVESVVCDGKDGALYDLSALEQKDKYELFLGGNYGQCVITTGTENGKHLLLVKDSFANSFVPFLTGDYETITMIDLRVLPGQHGRAGGGGRRYSGADGGHEPGGIGRLFQAE